MTFYLDSAHPEEIRQAQNWDFISGFTTNPLLMAKTLKQMGRPREDYWELLKELSEIYSSIISRGSNLPGTLFKAPVFFVQPLSQIPEEILAEAEKIKGIFPKNLILKIPFSTIGLSAAHDLKARGFSLAFTAVFSPLQAQIAAQSRVDLVIPFCHRVGQLSIDGVKMIEEIVQLFKAENNPCPILAASVKSQPEVMGLWRAGVDGMTLPYKLFNEIFDHPLSREASLLFSQALKPE